MVKIKKKTKENILAFLIVGIIALVCGVGYLFLNHTPPEEDIEEVPDNIDIIKEEPKLNIIDLKSNTRPYAVMINNNSAVWKYQSGLNDAYIVYEMLTEGGITREMALFKDKDVSKIASVRSSRHYFLDYALENDAIYVHWGWSPQAESDIKTLGINNVNGLYYEGTYFFRDSSIKGIGMEHKGYTTTEKIKAAAEKLKYRTTTDKKVLLDYSVDSLELNTYEGAIPAKYIEVPYSSSFTAKFYYDEENKVYKRSQNKTELVDYTSKERITTKNIIVYNVGYKSMDSYGRQNMDNIGSGEGYFISEGYAVPITWEKSSRSEKTIYKLKNGETLKVNDGNTYIGLEPKGRSIKINENLPT